MYPDHVRLTLIEHQDEAIPPKSVVATQPDVGKPLAATQGNIKPPLSVANKWRGVDIRNG